LSAYDIIIHGLSPRNYYYVIVASGSYFLMGFSAVLLGLRRLVAVNNALMKIPTSRLPINKKSLPRSVYNLIMLELERVSTISWESEPISEESGQLGWGRPEKNAYEHCQLKRQPSMSVQRFIDFLIEHKIIDRNLGHAYVEGYEMARFSDEEIPEEQYTEFMKLVLQLLRKLGFNGN
ncbi:13053_t:CDS:2, partial [Acaulospora colombiana]